MAKTKNAPGNGIRIVCQNKKAFHDYEIVETLEAGIVLVGTEVKSLREGRANLKDSYAKVRKGEVYLIGLHISPYSHASAASNHEPERTRKLLLHGREIKRLMGKTQERGFSLVALKVYFKEGKAKVEMGLAKGKAQYDKRETLKKRSWEREKGRLLRQKG